MRVTHAPGRLEDARQSVDAMKTLLAFLPSGRVEIIQRTVALLCAITEVCGALSLLLLVCICFFVWVLVWLLLKLF